MKKTYTFILFIALTIVSCTNKNNQLSEKEIDHMVELILDSNQVYEISQSLRFSNDKEQYNVLQYSRNDSTILYVETLTSSDTEYTREIYYKDGSVIFINENGYRFINQDQEEQYQQNRYFFSEVDSINYDKIIDLENTQSFSEVSDVEIINYNKPTAAIKQEGIFEMKFGEFLSIEPQTFLILENKESQYNVALFITQQDYLLDELFNNPGKYRGTTIFAHHEFSKIGGIERMIYKGGIIIEK